MSKLNNAGRSSSAFATAVEEYYHLKTVAIDAAIFVPAGKPNYAMSEVDGTMFKYAMTLMNAGHDVEFIVPKLEEKAAAQGFLEYLYTKAVGRHKPVSVKVQAQLRTDAFDVLITNRPNSFDDITRFDTSSSLQDSLGQQLAKALPLLENTLKIA